MEVSRPMLLQTSKRFVLIVGLSALAAPFGFSQQVTQAPPPYSGPVQFVEGVFVTPIPGQPLTAVVHIESTQTLADGSTEVKHTSANIARDSQGRIYNERRAMVSASFAADTLPPQLGFHIFDPVANLNTFLNPFSHLARQSVWTPRPSIAEPGDAAAAPRDPLIAREDLGTQTMENVLVRGTLKTTTIPASASTTGKAVLVTDETWYSDELRLNLLVKHTDPRTGQQVVTITHIDRDEPAHTWFEIPPNYKIVDETPVR
jgi:hypothetical protein